MANTRIHPVLSGLGGLRYDLPGNLIGDMEMTDSRNMTIENGETIKRYGYAQLGENLPLNGACIGTDYFTLFAGTRQLVIGTTRDLYVLNFTTGNYELITPGIELDNCDSGWASDSDTVAHDTDRVRGTASVKVTLAAARSENDCLAYHAISSSDASSYSSITFWIKSETALSAGAVKVVVSESDHTTGERTGTYVECDCPALTADTWTFVRTAQTLTDFNATISISLYAGDSLDTGTVVYLDDVRATAALTGNDDDYLESTTIRKRTNTDLWWIYTNGIDPIGRYSGSGSATTLISSWPSGVTSLTARQCLQFKDHLHLFDVSENGNRYPTRVRWSDTGVPDDFVNGNASYQDLRGGDWIQRAVLMGADAVAVLKERSIWLGRATGDSSVFVYQQQVPGLGVMAGRTAKYIRGRVVFLGWDDVYTFDGIGYEPIGGTIRRELFKIINIEQIARAFAIVNDDDNEYWLCLPASGKTYAYDAFVYNYEMNKWVGRWQFADAFQCANWYQKQESVTIGELSGTIGQQTWRFGDKRGFADAPVTVFADKDGYAFVYDKLVYNDDSATAIDAWWSTKDFQFTALKSRQLILGLDVYYTGGTLAVSYSTDSGVTWSTATTLAAQSGYDVAHIYWKLDCSQVRFRFRNNVAGEHVRIRELRIKWQPAGGRLS
jgi:hypothetical protein